MKKIAINGLGRIGRMSLQAIFKRKLPLQIVAINDLASPDVLAHLLEFDSTFGRFEAEISFTKNSLTVNGQEIKVFSEYKAENLPWKELEIETVLECTGVFRTREKAQKHLYAGSKRVIISAPAKDQIDATFVIGVNEHKFEKEKHFIISNASCTTNCLAPALKVLHENFKVEKGSLTTIHSFTSDQRLLDAPHSDLRRARSATLSMIPTSTGAAKAIAKIIPSLDGKLNGIAVRVPTATVSLVDLTVQTEKALSKEEVNEVFKKASENNLSGILGFETRPLVSRDFRMDSRSCIIDAQITKVTGNNLVKVLAWYDNEWGYANRLVELAQMICQ